jgi:hypothetical protein
MTRRTKIFGSVCLAVLLCGFFALFHFVCEVRVRAKAGQELSKTMSVRVIVGEALSRYYEQHGAYPQSLKELPLLTLRWGDEGSSVGDLEAWQYVSDRTNFTLQWTGERAYKLFLGGGKGEYYLSEDGYPKDEKR